MMIKTLLVLGFASLSANCVFADTCPGKDGVLAYSGTLPDDWVNSTQETISNGDHNLLQVTWKPGDEATKGVIYCTYSGSLVLSSKNTTIEQPTSESWKASQIKGAYSCIKGMNDCTFNEGEEE